MFLIFSVDSLLRQKVVVELTLGAAHLAWRESRMKIEFAEKLAAIVEEARRSAPKAIYVALYMVHACYVHGKHKQLARHICKFSGLELQPGSIRESLPEPPIRIQ